MASKLAKSLVAAATVLIPTVAFAHTGIGDASGFAHGFGHPISGLDHILAMLMVGVFAWQLGGRALWLVPSDRRDRDDGREVRGAKQGPRSDGLGSAEFGFVTGGMGPSEP